MLQLYDKNHNKIRGLINYKDLKIESELSSGNASLSFLISLNDSKGIEHEGYIRTKTQEYVIKEAPLKDKWNEVVADLNLEELKGNPIQNFDSTEQTINKCIELAIAGSGYTVEIKDDITKKRTVRATDTNSLDLLTEIKETYLVEAKFDTISKKIYVYEKIGSDKGAYFMDSLNLKKLEVTGDSYEFFTKIIAIGATNQETGKTLKVEVTNNTYSNKITSTIWKDERYTNEDSLREDAQYKLNEIAKPKKSYAASIYDLANMNEKYKDILNYALGDTITVIDKEKGIKEKLRIVKIIEYPLSPEDNQVELANAVFTFDQLVKSQKKYENTVDNITSDNGTVSPEAIKNSLLNLINVNIQSLSAVSARIGELFTNHLSADVANIQTGIVGHLLAQKIEATDLVASKINFDIAEGGSLSLKDLLTQFLSTGSTQTLHLTAGNVVIDEAVIKDAMIESVNAGKINAGTIDSNKVTLLAEKDGYKMVQTGRLIQFIDVKNPANPIIVGQIGFDASNKFNFAIKDSTGQYTVYDATGITEHAVPDGLIVNDMVADNANIAGSKVNIDSLIECVNNNNTKTLNASKIVMDGTTQTIFTAFKQIITSINNNNALGTVKSISAKLYNKDGAANVTCQLYKILTKRLTKGDKVTVSFKLKYSNLEIKNEEHKACIIQGYGNVSGWNAGSFPGLNFTSKIDFSKSSDELEISYYFFVNDDHLKNEFWTSDFRFDYVNADVEVSEFMVEIGDRTSWSLAPEDLLSEIETLQTEFNIQQGSINQLIKDTKITVDGTEKKLKDAYNETKSTVDATVQNVAKIETTINHIDTTNLVRGGGGDYLDTSLWVKAGFNEHDIFAVDNGWYRIFNQQGNVGIYVTNDTAIKAPADKKVSISFRYYCNDNTGGLAGVSAVRCYFLQEKNNSGNYYDVYHKIELRKTTAANFYTETVTLDLDCTKYKIRFDLLNNPLSGSINGCAFRFKDIMIVNGLVPAKEWSASAADLEGATALLEQKVSSVEVKTTDEAFAVQVQKNQNKIYSIRYIRDYCNGSTANNNSHWVEIQALSSIGTNLALNKHVTSNVSITNANYITDGDYKSTSHYGSCPQSSTTVPYVQIDLGTLYNNIDEIKIWHYYTDGRRYYSTKTEVSADGVHWITLFDSAVSGTYYENIYGHSIKVNGTSFNSSQVTINESGLHVLNGAIDIKNNAGDKVFAADVNGNLDLVGNITTKDINTNKNCLELRENIFYFYDWADVTTRDTPIGMIFSGRPADGSKKPNMNYSHEADTYTAFSYYNPSTKLHDSYIVLDKYGIKGHKHPINFYGDSDFSGTRMYWGDGAYINENNGNRLLVWLTTKGDTDWSAKFAVVKNDESKDIFRVMPYTAGNDKIWCNGNTFVTGDFYVTGNKHCIQSTEHYGDVKFYATEDTTSYFTWRIDGEFKCDKKDNEGYYYTIIRIPDIAVECMNVEDYEYVVSIMKTSFGDYKIKTMGKYFKVTSDKENFTFTIDYVKGRRRGFEEESYSTQLEKATETKITNKNKKHMRKK